MLRSTVTWVKKILMQAILNVHADGRFPTASPKKRKIAALSSKHGLWTFFLIYPWHFCLPCAALKLCNGVVCPFLYTTTKEKLPAIGEARGGAQGAMAPKFLACIVILCFERRYPKQNTVARLKSNILSPKKCLAPPKIWAGYDTTTCGTGLIFYCTWSAMIYGRMI